VKEELTMTHSKRWSVLPLLLFGICLAVLGCSQSGETAGARSAAASAKTGAAPAPPMTAAGPSAPAPPSSSASLTVEATGQVISVDPANKTLIVQSDAGSIAFEVQDRLVNDLQTLKPGDRVTVLYTQEAGKNSAQAIQKG
jgi:hypothetical protein